MRRLIYGCIGLVLLVGVGIWSYMWWHSPAETKKFTENKSSNEVLASETALTTWETTYFTTAYPDNLRIITTNELAHGITTGQYLLGSTSPDKTDQLGVTVGTLDGVAFDELPAIKLRRQHINEYHTIKSSVTPPGGLAFVDEEKYEVSMFWQQGNQYAAVVATGSSARQAELTQVLEAVVSNWRWR